MTCDEFRDRLNELAAGTLRGAARDEIEVHLATCAACRAEAAGLLPVLARVADLPRSIEPPPEVWDGIAARLGRRKVVEGRFTTPPRSWWSRGPVLAAAAVLLVVVTSVITRLAVSPGTNGAPVAASGALSSDFLSLEADYARAAEEIVVALEQGDVRIAPQTREILERNLRVIDDAINESRLALAGDPANQELRSMVLTTYQHKLDLLRRVTSPSSL